MKYLIILLFLFSSAKGQVLGLFESRTLNTSFGTGSQWLTKSSGFEGSGVGEINHFKDSLKAKFLYTATDSNGVHSLGLLVCDSLEGILTKRGKVIGVGAAGNRMANCSESAVIGDTLFVLAPSNYNSTNVYLYTSVNGGNSFTDAGVIISSSVVPQSSSWGNLGLLKDTTNAPVQINGKYQLFVEIGNSIRFIYELHILESASIRGPWTYVRKIGGALQATTIGTTSGPRPIYLDGVCHLFYHYSPSTSLPTYLGYATSLDFVVWKKRELPYKAFEAHPYGVGVAPWSGGTSQNADPEVFQFRGKSYNLSAYVENTSPVKSVIYKWKYEGTLKQLLYGLSICNGCSGVYP